MRIPPRKWPKTHSQKLFLRINENFAKMAKDSFEGTEKIRCKICDGCNGAQICWDSSSF